MRRAVCTLDMESVQGIKLITGSSAVVACSPPNLKVPGLNSGLGIVLVGYGCTTHVVVLRRSMGC